MKIHCEWKGKVVQREGNFPIVATLSVNNTEGARPATVFTVEYSLFGFPENIKVTQGSEPILDYTEGETDIRQLPPKAQAALILLFPPIEQRHVQQLYLRGRASLPYLDERIIPAGGEVSMSSALEYDYVPKEGDGRFSHLFE